jgi:hypothetical protein
MMAFKRIVGVTNERTVSATIIPTCGASDSMVELVLGANIIHQSCFLANLNSLILDYIARLKISATTINHFVIKQFPILEKDNYRDKHISFIIPRVFELVYSSWDMYSYADNLWKEANSDLKSALNLQWETNASIVRGGHTWQLPESIEIVSEGCHLPPFTWNEERRAIMRAELDSYYARLYGLNYKQLRYILDPADLTPKELDDILDPFEEIRDPLDPQGYATRCRASTFPGETFRVLKDKEMREYGEYRTRRLVLEAWNQLDGVKQSPAYIPLIVQERPAEPDKKAALEKPVSDQTSTPLITPQLAPEEPRNNETQPGLIDFSVYRCLSCDKMVMGYERENHLRDVHRGKNVEWKKIR